MLRRGKPDEPDLEEKRVIALELLAATAILSIVALVLYMIFSYTPS